MLSLILGFITGLAGPISDIVNRITELKKARIVADSDIKRAEINAELEAVHDRKAVLIAEAGNRIAGTLNAIGRTVIAIGPATVLLKILLWDKVVGSFSGCAAGLDKINGKIRFECVTFTTDPLDPYLWGVVTAVVAFYFLATKRK